ncbi:C4-dicarboxylate TRAP transporter large permease protein DctM [bacterium HR40]|nr:C4-dicarboxylate TRAP transporter large permease protein DctM [bacterium HR40]
MIFEWLADHLSAVMFLSLVAALFCGYPVAFSLGATGVFFGFIGWFLDEFRLVQFASIMPRIYGGVVVNQVLLAIPMFIFMGLVLEKARLADDLLHALQVLLRRIPGGLALSVAALGTIMAATTGIVGASVIMLTLMALPTMLERGYDKRLACGTIAASGTLGILIPPSIMLVILGDLVQVPVGTLFAGAFLPGFLLSGLYMLYIVTVSFLWPHLAPPLAREHHLRGLDLLRLVGRSLIPPAFLIFAVLGSIFLGWATPTEASGVGCAGALLLAWLNGRLNSNMLAEVIENAGLTNALVFFIIMGATLFSYVFRALGGDYMVADILAAIGIDTGWEVVVFLMILVFILGFFFDFIEISLIVLPIFYPILAKIDFSAHVGQASAFLPWITILIAVNLQTSFLTPPFGFTLFYMKGIVPPQVTLLDIYQSIVPFVILQLIGLFLCIFFPEIVLWLPRVTGFLD